MENETNISYNLEETRTRGLSRQWTALMCLLSIFTMEKARGRVQTDSGPMELEVPRDRKSDFQPKLIRKRQTVLDDVEDKIVAMYAKGMTTRDIQEILGDMYGMEISSSLISRLTDSVLPLLEEW